MHLKGTGASVGLSPVDADLITDFTRVVNDAGNYRLEVALVRWDVQAPCFVWKLARRWKRLPSPRRLASAQQSVLNTPRFFRFCRECGQRKNAGHMDGDLCHGCMERVFGVTF